MIAAIIFDMDGVVIDSHPIHRRSWSLFLQSVGKQVSDRELDFVMEGSKREDILRHFLGDLTESQLKEYGLQKETLFRQQAISIQAIAGVIDFLRSLGPAGTLAGLASSASQYRVNYILEKLDVARYFTATVTGDDVKIGKPDPAVFLTAAERLGVRPSDVIVFEDAIAGVTGAKAAGMKCVGVAQGSRRALLHRAGADWVISDFVGLTTESVEKLLLERKWSHLTRMRSVA
jgi:beta-phosphoglucomutase